MVTSRRMGYTHRMSVQPSEPYDDSEDVYFLPADAPPQEEDDAVELMWMERNATPFHPTPEHPTRATRCTGVTRNGPRAGKRCGRKATLGTTICEKHGANLPQVRKAAANRVNMIQLRLVGMTDDAVEVLRELMESADSGAVRLKAATEILDRSGVRGGTDINVTVEQVETASSIVRERLEQLKKRTIEGEVVQEQIAKAHDSLVEGVTVDPVDNTSQPPSEE